MTCTVIDCTNAATQVLVVPVRRVPLCHPCAARALPFARLVAPSAYLSAAHPNSGGEQLGSVRASTGTEPSIAQPKPMDRAS